MCPSSHTPSLSWIFKHRHRPSLSHHGQRPDRLLRTELAHSPRCDPTLVAVKIGLTTPSVPPIENHLAPIRALFDNRAFVTRERGHDEKISFTHPAPLACLKSPQQSRNQNLFK